MFSYRLADLVNLYIIVIVLLFSPDIMKVLLVALLVGAASAFIERPEWQAFKQQYGKSYVNPIEEFYRMKVYADNKVKVEQHMQEYAEGKHSYTLALNKFADLTSEEFSRGFKGLKLESTRPHTIHQDSDNDIPASMDWRNAGAVTAVKDQGQCIASWAFAATGTLEGAWKLAGNSLASLSEQQLIDCCIAHGDADCCSGGLPNALGLEYALEILGLESEADYPSQGRDSICEDSGNNAATMSGYVDITPGSERDLLNAIAYVGPVAAAIDASHFSFQLYSGGVYNEPHCSSTRLDHGVLVVGYGTESGSDYWLVKNSWGSGWGNSGYIKMSMNANNQCGIATYAFYAVV